MLLTVDLGRLELQPGDRVLDVGCGEGRHCFGALEQGARIVGLDLNREPLRQASGPLRARAHELGQFALVIRGDALRLPFADGTFDRVICSEVMEHVHDYRRAASELARVTRPGGTVAVTVPTATSEWLYRCLGDDYFETAGGHIRIFRTRQLARALAAVELGPASVGFAHALHTPYWMLRSLVGLPRADANRLVQAYRLFLIRAAGSRLMRRIEAVLNHVCPKSLILYARRRAPARPVAAP